MSELRGFKYVTTLVLALKKIKSEDKTKYNTFYSHSKAKKLLMEVTLMMYLNQSILQLYQTYKDF